MDKFCYQFRQPHCRHREFQYVGGGQFDLHHYSNKYKNPQQCGASIHSLRNCRQQTSPLIPSLAHMALESSPGRSTWTPSPSVRSSSRTKALVWLRTSLDLAASMVFWGKRYSTSIKGTVAYDVPRLGPVDLTLGTLSPETNSTIPTG